MALPLDSSDEEAATVHSRKRHTGKGATRKGRSVTASAIVDSSEEEEAMAASKPTAKRKAAPEKAKWRRGGKAKASKRN